MSIFQEDLDDFLTKVVAPKALQFDEGGIHHTHTKADPAAPKPPFKFNLCTPNMRPEGRMDEGQLDQMASFIGQAIIRSRKTPPALAGVPNVGEDLACRVWMYLRGQGMYVPRLRLRKNDDGSMTLIDRAGYLDGPLWLIDDLIHRSLSKQRTAKAFAAEGYAVTDLWCFLTYGQGGEEELKQLFGIDTHSIESVRRVFELGKAAGSILPHVYCQGMKYLEQTKQAA